ncbi:ABC transporter substrate-binding protein [Suttonella ornithocola]|uniref:Dipeptide-binding protein n=1 Tax=Suttonella ornithocola TaxID=279832 RepID=A0A380MPU9_9GAMM|nr:ABC transporter substrate-binding protein [Suttonella ornithocola]SUO94086.1 Dipeptide-binding protein [Suttonella ornithocola]
MKMKKSLFALAFASAFASTFAADITIAYDADPVSMDPMEQLSQDTMQMLNMVFDPLVRYNSKLEVEPRLAESWEQLEPTVIRFHLRKGVKFHSGNEMTADDVIFSFNREKQSADFKAIFDPYLEIRKIDDHTVDLVMKEPYPLVLPTMSYLAVMDSKFYSGKDDKGNDKARLEKSAGTFASMNESGTGPFVLESRQQGVRSIYKKFADYWDKDTGNVEKVTLVPIKENATRVSALLSGDVDWIYPVPPTDIAAVEKNPKYDLYSIASDRLLAVQINQKVVPEFKDKRVREAMAYAVNNAGIVQKIMRGNATVGAQNSPEGYTGYNPDLKPRYDLGKAKALMKEAGLEKGFTVTMISPNNRYVNDEKIAQSVAAMLAKINIKVNLTTMPKAQYWDEFDKCAAGLQVVGWSSDTGDSANYSEFLTMTRDPETGMGAYNCNGYSNPTLDKLIKDANKNTNTEARNAQLREASKIEYDDTVFIPLHWENLNWGYTKKFENFPEIVNLKNFPHWEKLKVKE